MSYKQETIRKVTYNLAAAVRNYKVLADENADAVKLAISKGNMKIGLVMNVSLAPILTCGHACKHCQGYCYDVKACCQYPNTVVDARARNTVLAIYHRDEYFSRIDKAMSRRRKNKYFRWHVAGDILDADYFDRMVDNARNHPDFVIWTYTKQYHIVNEWIANNGNLPANFHVMFSEWRGLKMENPYGMPEFRVVFKDDAVKPDPRCNHYCPGNCDVCKKTGRGCIAGETTYCNEH